MPPEAGPDLVAELVSAALGERPVVARLPWNVHWSWLLQPLGRVPPPSAWVRRAAPFSTNRESWFTGGFTVLPCFRCRWRPSSAWRAWICR